jgi:hypothetical protein
MKRTALVAALAALCLALPSQAQSIFGDLDRLAAKASESVEVSLDANLLRLAGGFFSANKKDEAAAKDLVSNLKGIWVRSFEFAKEGEYSQADLQTVRNQLKAPGWSRIVGVQGGRDGVEVYVKTEAGKTAGLALLSCEPKELSMVYIEGPIDIERLSELGGKLGVPALPSLQYRKKALK